MYIYYIYFTFTFTFKSPGGDGVLQRHGVPSDEALQQNEAAHAPGLRQAVYLPDVPRVQLHPRRGDMPP